MIRNIYHKPKVDPVTWFMLAWLLVIMLSCNVIKGKRSMSVSIDSVSKRSVAVVDTGTGGQVSRGTSKQTDEWWKTTLQFPHDTIHNTTNVYPSTVIYEGGKGVKETTTTDSSWFKNALSSLTVAMDSLSRRVAEQSKDKQTSPSIWLYVTIAAGVLIAWKGLGFCWKWVTTRYHIFTLKSKA